MSTPNFKSYRVPNRLGKLLQTPGGISREQAVQAAGERVESLREKFLAAIPNEIGALEEILARGGGKTISEADLQEMLTLADQVLTLSGTYGLTRLDTVVKRFCDLAMGMIDKKLDPAAPVAVHLRAMRLVSPGAAELSDAEAAHVLDGLVSIHIHYGIATVAGAPPAQANNPNS
ncbi:hypothetical protein FHS83_002568 [Rhizomicrobium palustre]|uniref:Uncharacterized protein n=1 Tax=Rhizomicrobium palustre TaxID=189966 RepID=A0A846N2C5_9PROT|nr:hypothetical protein [Rhizomicrobium palustre]NIK89250.1 hypothetical protein [Rhizomicrobium palustre]